MSTMSADLEELQKVFEAHRTRWIEEGHEGKWAVVTSAGAFGFYDTYEQAYLAAAGEFGKSAFLLQQVLPEDPIESVQHARWA